MLKIYYSLIKPRMVFANALAVAGGFFLASKEHFSYNLFFAALVGISFVIAGGCVLNNYIDRDIDKIMDRTKTRALPMGAVSGQNVVIYGVSLTIFGIIILVLYTNILTLSLGLLGIFFYLVLYSWAKRHSSLGTLVGSIAGSVPPLAGYCVVTNSFDLGAIILFITLCLWQMPHFYSIAIYRFDDYTAASIPVLPVKKGIPAAKIQIVIYIMAFIIFGSALTAFGYAGYTYVAAVLILGFVWLEYGFAGFRASNDKPWARKMFIISLITITAMYVAMIVDSVIKIGK